ncbi:MAG: DNA methyltransferase [Verrucomicrobiota bacterium]
MPLSWNEIRHRAITFAREWKGETCEAAERQTFWNEFFNVFGVRRRTVATFEEPVKKLSGDWGFIDLFWPGRLLVEHKSAGADLGKAHAQGMDYIRGLKDTGRDREIPRWLIVSDFNRIALHDLEPEQDPDAPLLKRLPPSIEFPLADFHQCIRHFAFIAGYIQHRLNPEDPANLEATQLMCNLHDALEAGGYTGHELKRFLVRILFCLFAEDNGIFPQKAFELFLRDRTADDGSDLGVRLEQLFRVLNTDTPQRQKKLDEELSQFPYVNGELFAEHLEFAEFNADMRNGLLACCAFRWETISPAVFGSLFQAVMDSKERRQIGAHYTAEKNILKLIRSLFLDDLRAEFETIKADRSTRRTARLQEFHDELAKLRFLDPACGCGNFLVLTYRELRKLELEVLLELYGQQHEMSLDDVNRLSKLNVHQFYGIEVEEFPARIAEVALWLADHQANVALSQAFSQLVLRLPLRSSPHIVVANALRTDWRTVLPPEQCSFVLGNPPFVGKQFMIAEQKADMEVVCGRVKGSGVLDFVTGWYFKAAEYVKGTAIRCAFVSTNSISQGEQPGVLWAELFARHRMKIHFAHRTFPWESEARGKAHVHVVIIGFGAADVPAKFITDYDTDLEHPTRTQVSNINPYLVEGGDTVLAKRNAPLFPVPEIVFGSMPNDGGHLLLSSEEKAELLRVEPGAAKFLRPFVGAEEFINGAERWCLWLAEATASELRSLPTVFRRVQGVKQHRLQSPRATTRQLAAQPSLFGENRQPTTRYLLIPGVSSENRNYIPIGFLKPDVVASNLVNIVPGATLYHFAILTSAMHMAWVRHVCGRLKSDFRYSNQIVYNNFPWPVVVAPAQLERVEEAAQRILDLRAECGDGRHGYLPVRNKSAACTLAHLYDPVAMPGELAKAHAALDRSVDRCYRPDPFPSDRHRVEFLFALYEKITAPLVAVAKKKGR